jgi:hypothetical protein
MEGPIPATFPFKTVIESREEEARNYEQLAQELGPRIKRNVQERSNLVKLINAGVMMPGQVKDNLASVDRRLEQLTRARDAAIARAAALRGEAEKLRKREEEIKREIFRGSGTSEKR